LRGTARISQVTLWVSISFMHARLPSFVEPRFSPCWTAARRWRMTRAAISAAGDVQDLWIVADDEGQPKHLYARLGFRPAWTALEALRLP
jgi:hypothetical protein